MSISGITTPFTNHNPRILNPITPSTPKSIGNCKFNFRVYTKVAIPEPNAGVYDQIAVTVNPSGATTSSYLESRNKKDDEDKRDYYLNIGYAIRCLREEFPDIFNQEPNFDIFRKQLVVYQYKENTECETRDDIVFKDPLNTFSGIENYKSIFGALRFHGRIFFKALWVDILSVWQPSENIILIRWTIHGIPRVPWESRGRFDGISEYKLDKKGKIYEHKVDNIALNSLGKFQALSVQDFILSLSCPSTPKPTCFELSSSSSNSVPLSPFMESATQYFNYFLELSHKDQPKTSQKP